MVGRVENSKLIPGFRQFTLPRGDGTLQTAFLVDQADALTTRKPLMVFVDGSGAQSQFFVSPQGSGHGVYGAIAHRAAGEYHVATCEKRGVEFGQMFRAGSAEGASAEYSRYATFEDRVSEVKLLIDRLLREPMIDASRVVLLGHSEGADVAAGVAAAEPRVTHVAFLSGGGPTQLFDLIVLRRKEMTRSGATPEQIEAAVGELEKQFRLIFRDPQSDKKYYSGHAYRRWASFCSHPPVDSLLKGKARLFLAHGTEDASVPIESFDALVADLIRHQRADVTIRRYPGRSHSLAPPGAGQNDAPLGDVFDEIVAWAREP